MRNYFVALIIVFITILGKAQNVAINSSGAPAHPAAILDISSEDKGLLIPRMTTAQREAMANPPMGLLVFDITSRSLWFHTTEWNEVVNTGDMGTAGGDLDGQYPDPLVSKIQGHPVSALTADNRQALKWDADNFTWRGMNDSLYFPFIAVSNNTGSMFSLNNTNNSFSPSSTILALRHSASGITLPFHSAIRGDAASAVAVVGTSQANAGIYGQSGQTHGVVGVSGGAATTAGIQGIHGTSGFAPETTMGVWGDNQSGIGVLGTSSSEVGVYGISSLNHGIYGYGITEGWAGVKGSHANTGGIGIYGDVSNGTGVLGEIQVDGSAVHGRVFGDNGVAGRFESSAGMHSDMTLLVETQGTGSLSVFQVANAGNAEPGVAIGHTGTGDGIAVTISNALSEAKGVNAVTNGSGPAIYGRSETGAAGEFEILNLLNSSPAVEINNNGSGIGLNVASATGDGARIAVNSTEASSRPLTTTNAGLGTTALFKNLNALSDSSVVRIEQPGTGHGLSVIIGNSDTDVAGLSLVSAADWGITSTVFGQHAISGSAFGSNGIAIEGKALGSNSTGVKGVSTASAGGSGVVGEAMITDVTGVGVKGSASSIGVHGLNTATAGGRGVYGESGINNATGVGVQGSAGYIGVFGETLADNGIGLVAQAGFLGTQSTAALIQNLNSANLHTVMNMVTNGLGRGILLTSSNTNNSSSMIHIENAGTGAFLLCEDAANLSKFSVASSGNVTTNGTVTVKGNKGIIRNSSSTQMRVETLSATFNPDGFETLSPQEVRNIQVTFGAPFSSAPVVYIANITQNGNASVMLASVLNVTTTGCTLHFMNPLNQNVAVSDSTWKLMAMGAE